MKQILLMIAVVALVGCGTPAENATKANTDKELTLEEKVAGTYEEKDIATEKWVFLANGISEYYKDNKKTSEFKWTISKDGEIHIERNSSIILIYRINRDRSITFIAEMEDGKRTAPPKEDQFIWEIIK